MEMGKFSSICDSTESDRQKAVSELNESDDLECRIKKGYKECLPFKKERNID